MRKIAFKQVDVFTRVPFKGNPVAVVLEGNGLSASEMGWRMAATVAAWPDWMCASIIWLKSMRYTWSAPTTTMMSGCSS